jgi:hypothetical protein
MNGRSEKDRVRQSNRQNLVAGPGNKPTDKQWDRIKSDIEFTDYLFGVTDLRGPTVFRPPV